MIVSHLHRFIFVKTHKTAGTSMEIALSGHCGPNDIITRLSPDDEKYRQELGSPGPQNDVIRLRRHPPRRLAKALRHLQRDRFHNHMPATTIRGHVGGSVWDSYFKFTIERNPFDRAVSRYWYSTQGLEPRPSMTEYLLTLSPAQLQNWPIYTIDDQVAVDWVMRYEDLDEEVVKLGDRLGVDLRLPEKRAKGQSREDRRPHREVIEPAARAWIEEVCGRELQEFGYWW